MRRTAAALALCAIAVLVPSAEAAPTPQLTDPAGDYPVAGADIVSGLFVTSKSKLIVTIEFSDAPNGQIPYAYQLQFTAGDCDWRGNFFAENDVSGGCRGSDSDAPVSATAKGNTVVFTMAAKGALKPGTTLTGINANNSIGGVLAGGGAENTGDRAETATTYTVGK